MKKILILTMLIMLISTTTAFAEEATPYVKSGTIEVIVNDGSNLVTEEIILGNAETFENGTVEHILTNFGEVSDLTIASDGTNLDFKLEEDKTLSKLLVTLPDGVSGDFSYNISFNYASEGARTPIVVPSVSTDGDGNDILLKVTIPNGQYLHDSFPIIDGEDTGSLEEYMMNIPNFVNLEIEDTPKGFFTETRLYSLFGFVVILGIIAAWLISERKASQKVGGVTNV